MTTALRLSTISVRCVRCCVTGFVWGPWGVATLQVIWVGAVVGALQPAGPDFIVGARGRRGILIREQLGRPDWHWWTGRGPVEELGQRLVLRLVAAVAVAAGEECTRSSAVQLGPEVKVGVDNGETGSTAASVEEGRKNVVEVGHRAPLL